MVVAETETAFELVLDVPYPQATIAAVNDTVAPQQVAPSKRNIAHALAGPTSPLHEAQADQGVAAQELPGASSVDRLWSLRRQPTLGLPRVAAPPETERPLLGAVPSKPQPPTPVDPDTVKGRGGVEMHLAENGSIERFNDPPADVRVNFVPLGVGIGGRVDLTDKVMRAAGMNPYR